VAKTLDALSEAKEQRQRYEQARQRLEQEIRELATGLTSTQDRAEVLSYLYWQCEDLQVSRLYEIFRVSFHDGLISPQQKTLPCRYCGQSTSVLFASREALKRSDGMGTCVQCQHQIDMAKEAKKRAREEAWERQREAMRAVYDDTGLSDGDCSFFEDLLLEFRQQDELRKSAAYIGKRWGRYADEIQRWLRSLERKGMLIDTGRMTRDGGKGHIYRFNPEKLHVPFDELATVVTAVKRGVYTHET